MVSLEEINEIQISLNDAICIQQDYEFRKIINIIFDLTPDIIRQDKIYLDLECLCFYLFRNNYTVL